MAAMATLLKRQNPIALSRSAWWPGGLTAQKTRRSRLFSTVSMPAKTAPAAAGSTHAGNTHPRIRIQGQKPSSGWEARRKSMWDWLCAARIRSLGIGGLDHLKILVMPRRCQ